MKIGTGGLRVVAPILEISRLPAHRQRPKAPESSVATPVSTAPVTAAATATTAAGQKRSRPSSHRAAQRRRTTHGSSNGGGDTAALLARRAIGELLVRMVDCYNLPSERRGEHASTPSSAAAQEVDVLQGPSSRRRVAHGDPGRRRARAQLDEDGQGHLRATPA